MAVFKTNIRLYPRLDKDILYLEKKYDVLLSKLILGAIDMELSHENKQYRMPTVERSVQINDEQQRNVFLTVNDNAHIEFIQSITKGYRNLYIKTLLRRYIKQYLDFMAFGKVIDDPTVTYIDMPGSGRKRTNNTSMKRSRNVSESMQKLTNSSEVFQGSFESMVKDAGEKETGELHVTELKDYFDERNKALLNKEKKSEIKPIKSDISADKISKEPLDANTAEEPAKHEPIPNEATGADEKAAVEEAPNLMKWLEGDY